MEHHQFVQPIDELGTEVLLHDFHHGILHARVVVFAGHFLDHLRAQVAGHDDHRVAEIHGAALTVGQATVVEHLQQHVEDIVMGLLDLVEQDHAVRPAAHGFGQIAALFVADIARRRTDQSAHGMLLHELAHVDAHHGLFGVEQEAGQGLAQLGLADAGRAQKQEGAIRPARIRQTRTRAPDGIGHRSHGLVLTDHALVQLRFHAQQLLALAFQHLRHRNPGPAADHLGDLVLGDLVLEQGEDLLIGALTLRQLLFQLRNAPVLQLTHLGQILGTAGALELVARLFQLLLDLGLAGDRRLLALEDLLQIRQFPLELADLFLQFAQTLLAGLVGLLLQGLALHLQLDQAPLQPVHVLRFGVHFHADTAGGLVHQIDGLVRQLAVGDVAMRQRGCGHDGRIGDLDPVMQRVTLLQAAQDGDGVLDRGLTDEDFLETALECGVLLDVLAVFVQGGGADAMQLTARQRRLEHVAGIHRTFGLAGADHGVQLVDEQDHLPFLLGEITEHASEALFKLTAELGTGDQGAHVQRQQSLAADTLGHFAIDDALGQAFDDGGLAHAGLADEHWIVLGAALQHLDGAADFLIATNHRIDLALLGALGQIDGVFLQGLTLFLGIGVLHLLAATHAGDRLLDPRLVGAGSLERLAHLTLVIQRCQHEQLAGDELVATLLRQLVAEHQQTIQIVADRQIALITLDLGQLLQGLAKLAAQSADIDAGLHQQRPRRATLLVQQGHQHVHRLDQIVVTPHRQRLGIGQCLLEARSQFVHAHGNLLWTVTRSSFMQQECGCLDPVQGP